MKEWLGVMTSSPAPTSKAASAMWSAAVQLDTAHALNLLREFGFEGGDFRALADPSRVKYASNGLGFFLS
jgi:hypothetical protein